MTDPEGELADLRGQIKAERAAAEASRVAPPEPSHPEPPRLAALKALLNASNSLADARQKHAEAFLLAKISSRKPTDRQAEASAEVERGSTLLAAETLYFIAKAEYAAALGLRGV